jgi:hypothetical protein
MKSISIFEEAFLKALNEDMMSGGASSVFGSGTSQSIGNAGNQFPSQNDNAYAPGDSRIPKVLGRKKKGKKPFIQRRPLPGLMLKSP